MVLLQWHLALRLRSHHATLEFCVANADQSYSCTSSLAVSRERAVRRKSGSPA